MAEVSTLENHFSIDNQKRCFERGTQYVKLLRAASSNSGIHVFGRNDKMDYVARFESESAELSVAKFVPASGAASRMFKELIEWTNNPKKHAKAIKAFFEKAEMLPFFDQWMEVCNGLDIETYEAGIYSKVAWLKALLYDHGMNFIKMPKGVIPFHQYEGISATPIQEHIAEAMQLVSEGVPTLHFTISPAHREVFESQVELALKNLNLDADSIKIEFSVQDPETDTLVLDTEGNSIKENGVELKRPGGHGALIRNLSAMDADVIFIKNIDNVAHGRLLPETIKYKKLLAGVLLDIKSDMQRIHDQISKGLLDEVSIDSARDKWGLRIPRDYVNVKEYLKRPIRVCGMVKNEGEPGGGPFWTLDKYTGESLQIVEQSQIDKSDMRQEMILKSAKHFNPVDIVCSIKGLDGNHIDLLNYVKFDQYFIADKTLKGEQIKALEWPGLWNGAMAHWVTVFVEVPIQTFNPVKELSDLFRKTHTTT